MGWRYPYRRRSGSGAHLGSALEWSVDWGPTDRAEAIASVHAALDAGVTWIDTAPFYGWGRAEEIVGAALGRRRDEVVVLTTCGTFAEPSGGSRQDHRTLAIRTDIEASLRRLRTDYIDVVPLHDSDSTTPIEDSWGTLRNWSGRERYGRWASPTTLSRLSSELSSRRGRAASVQNPSRPNR